MKKNLGIRPKLLLSILLILTILWGIVAVFTYYKISDIIVALKRERMEEMAHIVERKISSQIHGASSLLRLTASFTQISENLDLPIEWSPSPVRMEIERHLNRINRVNNYYKNIMYINSEGYILAGTSEIRTRTINVAHEPWFKEAMEKNILTVSKPIFDAQNKNVVLPISFKLVHDGKTGIITGMLELSKLAQESITDSTENKSVVAYVIDSTGKIVAGMAQEKLGDQAFDKKLPIIKTGINGTMLGCETKPKSVVGFYHIPQTGLYAIAIAEESFLQNYAHEMRTVLIMGGCFTLLLIYILLMLLLLPIVREIKRLSQYSEEIATGTGEKIKSLDVSRGDELGHLGNHLNQMVTKLNGMVVRSEAATKAKSDFLARMSHEIRTPMNGIIGMTNLAFMQNPEPKQRHYLKRIDQAATHLLGIINDILDFSKIEANKLEIKIEPISLDEIINPIQDLLAPKIVAKKLEFSVFIDDDVPKFIIADALRLNQVCINLCNNSLKFTEKGFIHLKIALQERINDNATLLFTVEDSGIGVAKEYQEHIFDSFTQADDSFTRKVEGTGLGLTICKHLVELMGGKIWMESEVGKGSSFYFTTCLQIAKDIPLMQKETIPLDQTRKTSQENIYEPKILLVEDNEINQEIAKAILTKLGTKVHIANNGQEAVDRWTAEEFDMIFMDIQMPIMDGYTATQHIRKHPRGANVPIFAMTANALSGDKEKSLELGMTDHITKPINFKELTILVRHWTQKLETEKAKKNAKE